MLVVSLCNRQSTICVNEKEEQFDTRRGGKR